VAKGRLGDAGADPEPKGSGIWSSFEAAQRFVCVLGGDPLSIRQIHSIKLDDD
jgi:hypothetical protein